MRFVHDDGVDVDVELGLLYGFDRVLQCILVLGFEVELV